MLSRRSALFAALFAASVSVAPALATETKPFTPDAFAAAQKAGKPIFVAIHASGARMQSTLIAFKGEHETGRSTDQGSIAALLNKTL